MLRRWRLGGAALVFLVGLAAPVGASELMPTIDLDYSYQQKHTGDDVFATTNFRQRYRIGYETALSSSFDLLTAVKLEIEDKWSVREAHTSRIAPTLELQVKGSQALVKLTYEGVKSGVDQFNETAGTDNYSNSILLDAELTPIFWPQVRLRLQSKRDYAPETSDRRLQSMETTVLKDIDALRLEFNVRVEHTDTVLAIPATSDSVDWSLRSTYKEVFWSDLEFEFSYELKESDRTEHTLGSFTTDSQDYTQTLRQRMRKSLDLTPRLSLALIWEYQFDQDMLQLSYDTRLNNVYEADLRWEALNWVKLGADLKRESNHQYGKPGDDDVEKLNDTLRFAADLDPMRWLKIASRAELSSKQDTAKNSGNSPTIREEEKYETIVKNRVGEAWDLTLDYLSRNLHTNGWLTETEGKFKGDLALRMWDWLIQPSYEVDKMTDWKERRPTIDKQRQTTEAKIRFEWRQQFLDMLAATFSHEYGVKTEDNLDQVLTFDRTTTLTEDTRLDLVLVDFIRDVRLEGEIDRKATDTEGDADPMLVDVSYSLKLDYKLDYVALSANFKYNSKGSTFDDMLVNTKIEYKGDRVMGSIEYEFDKVFADIKDETRKLGVKFGCRF
jgi:predicted porin